MARAAVRWVGRAAALGYAGEDGAAEAALISGVFMAGLLPRRGQEVLSDHLTEYYQDLLTGRWRQVRPDSGQWTRRRCALAARGGTRGRRVRDMADLLSVRRDVPGTTAPAAAKRPRRFYAAPPP